MNWPGTLELLLLLALGGVCVGIPAAVAAVVFLLVRKKRLKD